MSQEEAKLSMIQLREDIQNLGKSVMNKGLYFYLTLPTPHFFVFLVSNLKTSYRIHFKS